MSRPEFYPERPTKVELIQTHISCVFLAGEFVYKIRKPVRFAFLDYSTIERRYHFSQEEVRLNGRLAPGIYLAVLPILRKGGGLVLGEEVSSIDASAEVAEYAVKMRRLSDDRMLERLVLENRAGKDDMTRIAVRLAEFHAAAADDRANTYGQPDAIAQAVLGNIAECEPCVGETLSRQEYDRIQNFQRSFLETRKGLLGERLAQGRVREGHGDLRCEHICLTDGIIVFDCLEFSERLRYGDVASDLAFLAMDLDRLEASELADVLVNAYSAKSQDRGLFELMRFYKCHRAAVRGKVSTLKSHEGEITGDERARAKEVALTCFRLAYRYASGTMPALVIVCGLSGTGKSTVAKALAGRTGFEIFNSDVIRKRLSGLDATERASATYRAGIYDEHSTEITYAALLTEAEKSLRAKNGVIVDATFKNPAHRQPFVELGARLRVPIMFVECRVDENEVRRRLLEREQRPDAASDANWEVYQRQKAEFVPITEIDERSHLVIDGKMSPNEIAGKIEAALDQLR